MNEREVRFDNLKGLLILLVVFGHCIEYTNNLSTDKTIADYIYVLMYTFNMSTFSMISGYFSKKSRTESIISLLVLFTLFHFIGWLLFVRIGSKILTPWWTSWYLLSLIFWKALIPIVGRFRFALPVSIIIAILTGFTVADRFLAISRTICFFPYFIAGYKLKASTIELLRNKPKITFIMPFIFVFVVFTFLYFHPVRLIEPIYMTSPYSSHGLSSLYSVILRTIILCSGLILAYSLLVLITDKNTWLTSFGRNSLAIYILHSYSLPIVFTSIMKFSNATCQPFILLSISIAFAILFCMAFGRDIISRFITNIVSSIVAYCVLPSSKD